MTTPIVEATASRPAGMSRRGLLAGAATATAAATTGQLWTAASAEAAYLPRVRPYLPTTLPTVQVRHMANRFSYGYTPAMRREIREHGGPLAWFEKQLNPGSIDDGAAAAFSDWFPTLHRSASNHFDRARAEVGYGYLVDTNHARWTLLRRTYSNRQVHESMSEFWLNHLHVYAQADLTWLWRQSYDTTIRKHALGRFDDMLAEAVIHPTMLVYLDADLSRVTRRVTPSGVVVEEDINENLGRELLELHTVGRDAGYTEDMVKDSARILTGWTVDRLGTWARSYQPADHYTGRVRVLGFTEANADRDGRAMLQRYVRYLAHHRSTAQRIARKLAVRFVSDSPSQRLVDHLADVFQGSGTNIKSTLRALVRDPEFRSAEQAKVRTPTDDVCATLRVLGAEITRPQGPSDAANSIFYLARRVGQTPFSWGPPDGFPQTADAWSTPGRMMGSFHMHQTLSGHFYPKEGVNYRPHGSWLPQPRIRFDAFVDHLCRVLHGTPSTPRLLGAACICADQAPGDIITRDHVLIRYRMSLLLGLLLDTPQHLMR